MVHKTEVLNLQTEVSILKKKLNNLELIFVLAAEFISNSLPPVSSNDFDKIIEIYYKNSEELGSFKHQKLYGKDES